MSFRADGKRLKDTDPMYTIVPYIMDKRYDAMNMITIDIPLDSISDYLAEKREEGKNYSHMDVIISAYLRMAGQFPQLNRFIMNKRIYARNELAVAMVVLKAGEIDNGTMSKMYFDYHHTIDDVHNIITKYVEMNKKPENKNSTDKMIKFLLSLPGLPNFLVGVFKLMDRYGLLPAKIIDLSPFHTSLTISNLASIRTNHIFHHVYEFGTTSVFLAMGNSRLVPKQKGGEVVHEKCMPIGVVMDERICSGSYYAMAFRAFKRYLKNPKLLEAPPEKEPIYEIKFRDREF